MPLDFFLELTEELDECVEPSRLGVGVVERERGSPCNSFFSERPARGSAPAFGTDSTLDDGEEGRAVVPLLDIGVLDTAFSVAGSVPLDTDTEHVASADGLL